MQYLNYYNAFGSVWITPRYLGVTIYAFSDDGFTHKVASRFGIETKLPIKNRLVMPFAAELISGRVPQLIFSLDRTPDRIQALVDEAEIIQAMVSVAYDLMERLDFELPDA